MPGTYSFEGAKMVCAPRPLSDLDITVLDAATLAFFLDFDGTLADFSDDPAAVFLPVEQKRTLDIIKRATGSAVAIISGRPVADLERLVAPLELPLAGVHGLERRDGEGRLIRMPMDEAALQKARTRLRTFAVGHAGILAEEKPGSVALHYRKRPDLEALCMATARTIANENPGLKLLHGKMVIEIKAGHATKADAIKAFMREIPFKGRQPVFAGDDATDEDAFPAVEEFGGISIKVGSGTTRAGYRAADISDFRSWLDHAAKAVMMTAGQAFEGTNGKS
jgi:trehalose 6-phosphate phosphatase